MTDRPQDPSDPIDAEFEPAETASLSDHTQSRRSGSSRPGWLAWSLSVLLALGALGVSGLSSGLMPGFSKPTTDTSRIETDLAALRADVDVLREDYGTVAALEVNLTAGGERLSRVAERVGALEKAMQDLEPASTDVALDNTQSAAPIKPITPPIPAMPTPPDPALQRRVRRLERALAALGESAEDSEVRGIADTDDASAAFPSESLEAFEARIGALEAVRDQVVDHMSAMRARLGEQSAPQASDDAVETLVAEVDQIAAALEAHKLSVAFARLDAVVTEAPTVDSALDDILALRPGLSDLPAVQRLRDPPQVSRRALLSAFPALAEEARLMLDAATGGSSNGMGGFVQALIGDGVRRVPPDGAIAETPDTLDQLSEAVSDGDFETAIDLIDALPPSVQPIFTEWQDGARQIQGRERALMRLRRAAEKGNAP